MTSWCVPSGLFLFTRYVLKQQLHLRWALFTIFLPLFLICQSLLLLLHFHLLLVCPPPPSPPPPSSRTPLLLLFFITSPCSACNARTVLFLAIVLPGLPCAIFRRQLSGRERAQQLQLQLVPVPLRSVTDTFVQEACCQTPCLSM